MNEEEIRVALKLEPWSVMEQRSRDKGWYPRRTGLTTRMLVNVVHAAQYGKVGIIAWSHTYARQLVSEAKMMCVYLGLPPKVIGNIAHWGIRINTQGSDVTVFRDHYIQQR